MVKNVKLHNSTELIILESVNCKTIFLEDIQDIRYISIFSDLGTKLNSNKIKNNLIIVNRLSRFTSKYLRNYRMYQL